MKRKPPIVSIILFILLFVMLYFVEQKLHILASSFDPNIDIKIEEVPIGQASYDLKVK